MSLTQRSMPYTSEHFDVSLTYFNKLHVIQYGKNQYYKMRVNEISTLSHSIKLCALCLDLSKLVCWRES